MAVAAGNIRTDDGMFDITLYRASFTLPSVNRVVHKLGEAQSKFRLQISYG